MFACQKFKHSTSSSPLSLPLVFTNLLMSGEHCCQGAKVSPCSLLLGGESSSLAMNYMEVQGVG